MRKSERLRLEIKIADDIQGTVDLVSMVVHPRGKSTFVAPTKQGRIEEWALTGIIFGEIMTWTRAERARAQSWAGAVHLSASDNVVRIPKKPKCIDRLEKAAEEVFA